MSNDRISNVQCMLSHNLVFYFKMKEMWGEKTLRGDTRCWAQGMDGWRPLQSIPQLKWCLLATGNPLMNETDLAILVLNMLIKICEFYPNRWACETGHWTSESSVLSFCSDDCWVQYANVLHKALFLGFYPAWYTCDRCAFSKVQHLLFIFYLEK